MTISQPQNLLATPFANDGNFQIIPDADAGSGRASLSLGFPTETQRPLVQGGIAPNRLDFNGILHMLSAAMFWQQSGGQWTYLNTLNYATPCIVYHQNELWWCVKENGPDSTVVTPGTNETYWMNFLNFVAGGKSTIGNPVGTIIAYYGTTAPDGYLACDGSTFSATTYPELRTLLNSTILPDLRVEFLRGMDNGRGLDPNVATRSNGVDGTPTGVGSVQTDALQEISGTYGSMSLTDTSAPITSGAFYDAGLSGTWTSQHANTWASRAIGFLAGRVARTSTETRPHNVAVLYCIKHD